ncbi:MAG TPA: lipopolysaccharide biosynthesis protein [Pirellulales bacterium]|nr:lipopolysaccharide biosynthesis protein [Pirellulales bacterium]
MLTTASGPAKTALRTQTLAQGVALLLALTVAQRLVGFVRGVLFCRWLAADDLGRWDLAYGFLMFAAPLAVFGLPGSLGRYAETYRQRGRLRVFLQSLSGCSLALAAAAGALALITRDWLSQFIFGGDGQARLVILLAGGLTLWIVHTLLTALFNALRMTRAVAVMQFCHSLGFAVLGSWLLAACEPAATSVVWAFGGACLVSILLGFGWLGRIWRSLPEDAAAQEHQPSSGLRRLASFAFWVWTTNVLANLCGLADRWMLIQFSGLTEADALAQIGQYHSARLIPLLFLGVAEMLAGLITPHLARDWEAGRRAEVSDRLNLILKLFAISLGIAAVGILLIAPWLFQTAWGGKYAAGLALLPWTLTYCIWGSLAVVATNYLWCAERAQLASLALVVGLIASLGLNGWLLPRYGLFGAVLATSAANLTMLAAMYSSAWRCGMRFDAGLCVLSLAPAAIAFGPLPGLAMLIALALFACSGEIVFNRGEKHLLMQAISSSVGNALRGVPSGGETTSNRSSRNGTESVPQSVLTIEFGHEPTPPPGLVPAER